MVLQVSELWYYPVTVFVLVIDAIVFLFGVKVLLLMHNKPSKGFSKCIRIQFPIFVLLIFVSYLISTYCMILSEMLGDLCIVVRSKPVFTLISEAMVSLLWSYIVSCICTSEHPGRPPTTKSKESSKQAHPSINIWNGTLA